MTPKQRKRRRNTTPDRNKHPQKVEKKGKDIIGGERSKKTPKLQ